MSIFGAMHTSVSGMNAQSTRLSVLSENIANSDTSGYKSSSAEFETLLTEQIASSYSPGGVTTRVRHEVSLQGLVQSSASPTNLAIQGDGFFVVANGDGPPMLTRAGAFESDADGYLVNTAGFRLMGASLVDGVPASASGFSSLTPIKVDTSGLVAAASTKAAFGANLPSDATVTPAANLPSANAASAAYTAKSSLVVFDNLGATVTLDVYMAKSSANTWEATVYNRADAAPGGGFPYGAAALGSANLQFDPTTGSLTTTSASSISIAVPNGRTVPLDLSSMTQLASTYSVSKSAVDGNAPSSFKQLQVDTDGTVSAVYQSGASVPKFRVLLANVPAPSALTPGSGNVYMVNKNSGDAIVGLPDGGGRGKLISSALEASTVDIASELTTMIETQRSYTANSKAFQVGTDMADVLVNLKV